MREADAQIGLSRRERQIVEVLYRLGACSAVEVHEALPDAPSNTAVRTLLAILVDKGHVVQRREGLKNIYEPTVPKEEMARSVIQGVVQNFFDGSIERVVAALLDPNEKPLSEDEVKRLQELIDEARRRGS